MMAKKAEAAMRIVRYFSGRTESVVKIMQTKAAQKK